MHTIKLKIEEEKELFHPFDPDGNRLSEDVKTYLLDRLGERSLGENVELQICSAQPVNRVHIEQALQNWIEEEERKNKLEYRKNLVRQLWMFGVGVVFIVISLVLEATVGQVWYTILSTIGAFSMWEAASIWIVQNPKLHLHKKMISKLKRNTRISYQTEA